MFIAKFTDRNNSKCYIKKGNSSITFVEKQYATEFKDRKELEDLLEFYRNTYIEEK